MKRLFTIFLILALILSAAALAEESIVGCWYMLYDKTKAPEMAPNFQNYDYIISSYLFTEDGTIYLSEVDIKDGTGTPVFSAVGKWSKELSGYHYSMLAFGEGAAKIDNDGIWMQLQSSNVYLLLRKMTPYDPYNDYKFN